MQNTNEPTADEQEAPDPGQSKLEKEILTLLENTRGEYFVYDARNNRWGNSISFDKKTIVDGVPVSRFYGFKADRPNPGDCAVFNMADNRLGLFMFFEVNKMDDPKDMFFAKGVCIDNDYQAGFGPNGTLEAEPPSRGESFRRDVENARRRTLDW